MQSAAVCDRRFEGDVLEFGTTGYTMNNVVALYDRNGESIWWPTTERAFDAVAGPARGSTLEFVAKPKVMRLREWIKRHPETLVLLPPKRGEDHGAGGHEGEDGAGG